MRAGITIHFTAVVVLAIACASSSPLDPSVVTAVTVTPIAASVPVGATQRFTAIPTDADGHPVASPVTWSSSNPAVAIVDASGRTTRTSPGTTVIRATVASGVFGEATLTVTSTGLCSPPADAGDEAGASGIVYSQGFEAGPINSENTPGLRTTSHPNILMEWQDTVARTGAGAYHLRGGDLTEGDADIWNDGTRPFGGLEVWVGGAFCFLSFPSQQVTQAVWLIATSPTDGVQGTGDKPVAGMAPSGKLVVLGSNSGASSDLDVPLQAGSWYYIVLHGVNGMGKNQELYLYDGRSGDLLGRTGAVLDVTGPFLNPTTKWGFGTGQDSSGLEYYLDDIYHASGITNPGPIRVAQ